MKNKSKQYDNFVGLSFDHVFKNIQFLLGRDDDFIIKEASPYLVCRTLKGYFYYFDSKLNKKLILNLLKDPNDMSNIIIGWNLMKDEAKDNIMDK